MMIPNPTATSAADMAIENSTKICPSGLGSILENAISARFTAFAINSIEKINRSAFLFTTNPYIPIDTRITAM